MPAHPTSTAVALRRSLPIAAAAACALVLLLLAAPRPAWAQFDAADDAGGDVEALDLSDPLADAFLRLASEDIAVSTRARREIADAWRESGSASIDLLVLRGERAVAAQSWSRADRHFTQVVNLAPDFALGWVLRASARFQAGDIGLALGDAAEALRLEPRQFDALLLSALIYLQIDEPEKALRAARAALAINPHLEEAKRVIRQVEPLVEGVDA